ncbi:MAG: TetR/AcrR family transcriptional regulator [Bellilinea sp.]
MPIQQRAEETRTRILSAAQACFSRSGFAAASVADICAEAGVTKGAFYYHFTSKQNLFFELLKSWLVVVDSGLETARGQTEIVSDGLVQMAGATRVIFENSVGYLPLFLEFWQQSIRDPQVWEQVKAPYRNYQQYFRRIVDAGVADGSLQVENPAVAANALLGMAVGLILQGLIDPSEADWANIMQDSVRMVLRGFGK